MRVLVLAAVMLVSACAGTSDLSPKQALYATEAQYAHLGEAALVYIDQPLCDAIVITEEPCAELNVVRKLQDADRFFWSALLQAEAMMGTANEAEYLGAAVEAMGVMRRVLVTYAIKEGTGT